MRVSIFERHSIGYDDSDLSFRITLVLIKAFLNLMLSSFLYPKIKWFFKTVIIHKVRHLFKNISRKGFNMHFITNTWNMHLRYERVIDKNALYMEIFLKEIICISKICLRKKYLYSNSHWIHTLKKKRLKITELQKMRFSR